MSHVCYARPSVWHTTCAGADLDHYAKVLQDKPYLYGTHILPHDAGNNQLATGTSLENTLRNLGIDGSVLPRADLEDGINAVRMLLPKCWFDAERCERGLEALRQYRRDWDEDVPQQATT